MKKVILILAIVLACPTLNAQTLIDNIYNDVRRNVEWQIRSTINREINRAVYDASNEANKNRNAKRQSKFWTCPECHTQNEGNFCTHCGEKKPLELIPWTCPDCHHHNKGGHYCESCGHSRLPKTPRTTQKKEITLEELSSLNLR